jgi:hypothetical protein
MNAPVSVTATFSSSGPAWYSTGSTWNYRKPITILHGQVSGSSSLAYFPVLVSITDSNLAASAQSSGNDILFTASDGLTKLSHEIEKYTSSTGQLIAWVNIASLSPTADTVIYMYYGSSVTYSEQNPTGVWDSNFKGVWHLPNGTTLSANDSTSNANNGTNTGAGATTGEIDGAASFNGASSQISVGDASSVQVLGYITMSAWVNVAEFPAANNWAYVIGKGYDGGQEAYFLRLNAQSSPGNIQLNAGSFAGANYGASWTISGWNTNTWHHVVGTFDGSNWNIYFDGALQVSSAQANGALSSNLGAYLGAMNNQGSLQRYWNGDLDEVRLSSTARSAAWITTEFNNQSSPSTFISVGAQQVN